MVHLIVDDKKHSVLNLDNMENRCNWDANYYKLLENQIYIILRDGKEPTLFESTTNKPYSERKYLGGTISFKGCMCELDKIIIYL